MSNLTDFFPAPSGGGGGVLNEQIFTASGTFSPSTYGLAVGDKIIIFACGGGGGGVSLSSSSYEQAIGGAGGLVKQLVYTLTSTTDLNVIIGSGGATGANTSPASNGGATTVTVSGGATILSADGGNGARAATLGEIQSISKGPHWGSTINTDDNPVGAGTGAGPGVNGYGVGGGSQASGGSSGGSAGGTGANEGGGGNSGESVSGVPTVSAGVSGIVKIYY